MKIWIDADACPRVIKEIVFRASERLELPVILVANMGLAKHHSRLISSVVVADGFDAADDYIVEHATDTDVVITADIPLAARIVAKGAQGLTRVASCTPRKTSESGSQCVTCCRSFAGQA